MITIAKNKNELIEGMRCEKGFNVLAIHTGLAATVAREVAKLGFKTVSLVITAPK